MFEHLGGAGAGAAAGLDMVLMQQLRDQQMKEQIRQAQAREALAARELTQRELEHQSSVADRGREAERQAAKDAAAADATGRQERTLGNIAGVVDMSAEGLDPETATREVVSTSLRGGMEPPRSVVDLFKREPPKRHPMTVRGPNGAPMRRLVDESELETGVEEYREPKERPQGSSEQTWVIRNGQPTPIQKGTAQPGDRPYDEVAARQSTPKPAGANYAVDSATRVIGLVDAIEPRLNWKTTGVIGKGLSALPIQTDARDVAADIESLAGNIAYSELQKMRQASPTGGAIGQVSDFETKLLSGVIGSVRQDQSEANLRRNLTTIRESAARILEAAQKDAGTQGAIGDIRPMTSRDSGAAPAPKRMRFDAKGNPIP
jgi:hypothetical protein